MASVRDFIELLRSIDRLLNLEGTHGKALARLSADRKNLKAPVTRLEAREHIVVAEAKAAAGSAAILIAVQSVSDVARRISRLAPPTAGPVSPLGRAGRFRPLPNAVAIVLTPGPP